MEDGCPEGYAVYIRTPPRVDGSAEGMDIDALFKQTDTGTMKKLPPRGAKMEFTSLYSRTSWPRRTR
jgi:hypothetical protein